MIQGTVSSNGKSVISAEFCRRSRSIDAVSWNNNEQFSEQEGANKMISTIRKRNAGKKAGYHERDVFDLGKCTTDEVRPVKTGEPEVLRDETIV